MAASIDQIEPPLGIEKVIRLFGCSCVPRNDLQAASGCGTAQSDQRAGSESKSAAATITVGCFTASQLFGVSGHEARELVHSNKEVPFMLRHPCRKPVAICR